MATPKRQVLVFPVPSVPGTRHIFKSVTWWKLAFPNIPLRPTFSLGNIFSQQTHVDINLNLLNKNNQNSVRRFSDNSETPSDSKLLLRAGIHITGFCLETLLKCLVHTSICTYKDWWWLYRVLVDCTEHTKWGWWDNDLCWSGLSFCLGIRTKWF